MRDGSVTIWQYLPRVNSRTLADWLRRIRTTHAPSRRSSSARTLTMKPQRRCLG